MANKSAKTSQDRRKWTPGMGATLASVCECSGLTPPKKVYVVDVNVDVNINVDVDVNVDVHDVDVDVDADVDDVDVDVDAHRPYTHNVPTARWQIAKIDKFKIIYENIS